MDFSKRLIELSCEAEKALEGRFKEIDRISFNNTNRIMDAFISNHVSVSHFDETTGYGYDDKGRDTLDKIYAEVFGAEAAFARHNILSGTHALTIGLFGLLRPGDVMLSITGKPYDTLDEVIGLSGTEGDGSFRDFGVEYRECALGEDFVPMLSDPKIKVVYIQRSKGYMNRKTLSTSEIDAMIREVRKHTDAFVVVDNCYGEFVCESEPKADLVIGSLIKNPGGGIAECGGYLAGSKRAIELASYRYSVVGAGLEVGASLGNTKKMYKGLFMAPHVVAQAEKTAVFAAYIFEKLGYDVEPKAFDERYDIIQTVKLYAPEKLCAFCRGIQYASPVDSYVTPEPWDMPGYSDQVIMAAGAFTQGSSIELSADGPMRAPYTAFFQGGLTFEAGKLGILKAAEEVLKTEN